MRELSGADPPETTPLQFGRPVRCSDGPVGSLSDLVIDPAARRVSHVVVEAPNGAARLVPADLLVTDQGLDGDVVLSCSVAEVLDRGTIRTFSYVGPGTFPQNDERSDIGVEDMQVLPSFGGTDFGEFGADLWGNYTVTYDRIPPGAAARKHGVGDRKSAHIFHRTQANRRAPGASCRASRIPGAGRSGRDSRSQRAAAVS